MNDAVNEYHRRVQEGKRDEESKRDQLLLLIVGGALTVSFPFVGTLLEKHGALVGKWALYCAWIVWATGLFGALLAYECSIRAHQWVLQKLAANQLDPAGFASAWSRALGPANLSATLCAVIGFGFFGLFAIENVGSDLKVVTAPKEALNGQGKEVARAGEEGDKREVGASCAGASTEASRISDTDSMRTGGQEARSSNRVHHQDTRPCNRSLGATGPATGLGQEGKNGK